MSKVIASVGVAVAVFGSTAMAHAAVPPKLAFPAAGESNAIRNPALVIELPCGYVGSELKDGDFELWNDQGELLEFGPFHIAATDDGETTFVISEPLTLASQRGYTLSAKVEFDAEDERVRRLNTPRAFAALAPSCLDGASAER